MYGDSRHLTVATAENIADGEFISLLFVILRVEIYFRRKQAAALRVNYLKIILRYFSATSDL